MYCLIKSKKSPYYQLLYINNTGKRTTISTHTKIKSQALKFLTEFKESDNSIKIEILTIGEFKNLHRKYAEKKYSKSYCRNTDSTFRILIRQFGESFLLSDFTTQKLEVFFLNRFSEAKFGAHLNYRTLKAVFEKAVEWKYLSANPIKKIKMPKLPQNNVLVISNNDFAKILWTEEDPLLKSFYEFARGTGMRVSEITNLKWGQMNFSENIISVTNTNEFTTKSRKERIIPISKRVREILISLQGKFISINQPNESVFRNKKGKPFSADNISKRFKKSVKSADVNSKYHFHNLRSSFASDLLNKGVSIFVVQKLLGHSSVAVTEKCYSHLQIDSLKDAVNLL